MSYLVVIPARFGSSRLPGKPLADISGAPMVVRVAQRCQDSKASRVLVATDDQRIRDAVAGAGHEALMTSAEHASGTDRLQEVAAKLQLDDDSIIVNVQGDEPLIPAAVIDQVAANLAANPDCGMATLCEPITRRDDLFNANIVKVVFDLSGRALYFSRAPVPWHRDAFAGNDDGTMPAGHWWRHIGIYAYRAGFLEQFISWPAAEIENIEALEQLRAMANGVRIHVEPACQSVPGGVDTESDLQRVRSQFATD